MVITLNILESKIENWCQKLLDLSKRNKALNFKETKRSTLKLQTPDCMTLWNEFVEHEKKIIFPQVEEQDQPVEYERAKKLKVSDQKVIYVTTTKKIDDLQKTLRNLRNKSRTIMQDQGLNVLYLSFGFIKWYEHEETENFFLAPLILVPVTLSCESLSSPYVLTNSDEGPVVNPTLSYKLGNEYGIKLPEFDDDSNLEAYFDKLNQVKLPKQWEIVKSVELGLLSFLKINMYKDLKEHKSELMHHSIVRAIGGDDGADLPLPDGLEHVDFDETVKPVETFQILDADSSQQDALLYARKNISFVMQGPPGTGKSQTITNIIAEGLADGKKILFVSEKAAALEVVFRKLKQAKLDDFCLSLHSHKVNKQTVIQELAQSLELAKEKDSTEVEHFSQLQLLEEKRRDLNEYSQKVHTIIQPLNLSIFQVNGKLAKVSACEDIIFDIPNINEVTEQQYIDFMEALEQVVKTSGKNTSDFKNNPWNETILEAVTYDFRQRATIRLADLQLKLENMVDIYNRIMTDLKIDNDLSFSFYNTLSDVLMIAKESPTIPESWILDDELGCLTDEISESEQLQLNFLELKKEVSKSIRILKESESDVQFLDGEDLVDVQSINLESHLLQKCIDNDQRYERWMQIDDFSTMRTFIASAGEHATQYKLLRENITADYEDSVFDMDWESIYRRFKVDYTSFLKYFRGTYYNDKKIIRSYCKGINNINDEQIVDLLNTLYKAREIRQWFSEQKSIIVKYFGTAEMGVDTDYESLCFSIDTAEQISCCLSQVKNLSAIATEICDRESCLKNHYQFLYEGIQTNWGYIRKALTWANKFKESVHVNHLSDDFVRLICSDSSAIEKASQYNGMVADTLSATKEDFLWYVGLFDDTTDLMDESLKTVLQRCKSCTNLSDLEKYIDFKVARNRCNELGLKSYLIKIESMSLPSDKIIPIFQKRFYHCWLDAIVPEFKVIQQFRRVNQEKLIKEFAHLDRRQFRTAEIRIRKELISQLPSQYGSSLRSQMRILKHEIGKKRRIIPLRILFKKIPELLLKLRPCLMMSPLSVSMFLEANSYKFDMVIFDEASQVCTENAIGAIARGNQVIIAGDSHQLPPTDFFSAVTSSSDDYDGNDDDVDDVDAYESVLDEAACLPQRLLSWHYRSKNEQLIAFSNHKIYHNSLITFPSNVPDSPYNGVEYIRVDHGFYDRGGKQGNRVEAEKVAELVFSHFEKHSDRTLGVIAFGEVQQEAIEMAIENKRRSNPRFEGFFNEERDEPFFVKNLENVQGDERDTIIFSIGYAKDQAGVFHMNFGPLSRSGGERRLNVAITRAKYNILLVGSILPTDINLDRISSEGPKLLRSYIDFAINGESALLGEVSVNDSTSFDSPFESAVYDYLVSKGYKVATQVGCSHYRIDLAVEHPQLNKVFVLGIECDGATYHSARTARERDRLRQDVLENMGWTIYRVWSTDWNKDVVSEGKMLVDRIEKAISDYNVKNNIVKLRLVGLKTKESMSSVKTENNFTDGFELQPLDFDTVKLEQEILPLNVDVSRICKPQCEPSEEKKEPEKKEPEKKESEKKASKKVSIKRTINIRDKNKDIEKREIKRYYDEGMNYYNGVGKRINYTEAFNLLLKAANKQYHRAEFMVGQCYYFGQGVSQDRKIAYTWYSKAVAHGNTSARQMLAKLKAENMSQTPCQHLSMMLQREKEIHDSAIQCEIGKCYLNGIGTKENRTEAFQWFQKSAEQRNANAQFLLGQCYYEGYGTQKNEKDAITWFSRAAEQNHDGAKHMLTRCRTSMFHKGKH